ncbi:hypothetical protein [Fusobacterium necrogenes]|uniref:hypothetical protein n=1 Tax=Fusobacterium necrogenes TaxID=858 RepID=UPI00255C8FA4|nr:hypothetical protein [Fusobacterium necrogenes]
MIEFKKIDEMIELIENNIIPEGYTNNEFFMEFFKVVQLIPLSKYLRNKGKDSKLPKIMNAKKAGEILISTQKDDEIKLFLKRKGYSEIPQLDYRTIMLLRKIDLYSNWNKIIAFLEGKGSVAEINQSNRKLLLPQEIEILESYLMKNLSLNVQELNWLLGKVKKIESDKELNKALRKLLINI